MTPLGPLKLPPNLRVGDLVAKTARVTLKDTLRILAALDAVSAMFDVDADDVLDVCEFDARRPSPEQVAACEQAFFTLKQTEHLHADEIRKRLKQIKSLT